MFRKIDQNYLLHLLITFILNFSATGLSFLFQSLGFKEVNFVVIYILSVLLTSRYTKGYIFGIIASVLSMLSFNFFFTEPLYTFTVDDTTYVFTFIVLLVAAILTSTLTSKLISSKEIANEREKQSQALYQITSSLAKAVGVEEVALVSVQYLVDFLKCEVTFVIIHHIDKKITLLAPAVLGYGVTKRELPLEDIESVRSNHYSYPIVVRGKYVGLILLPKDYENKKSHFLFDSIIMQITIAIQREILTSEKEMAKRETEKERFKSNLLRAISHDLRTPLSGITGSAEILLTKLTDEEDIKLVQNIYEDSSWLIRLVENILSLTRIQEGRLAINIQPEAVEEIIEESVSRASKYTTDHQIKISIPEKILFVPMDGKLIIQVLINMIDNAIKHTTPSDEINVTVRLEGKKVWFEISDTGTGINPDDLPKIFDMFFISRDSHTDARRGIGLGLSICKAIIDLHGGGIMAENNLDKGMTFRFYLNI